MFSCKGLFSDKWWRTKANIKKFNIKNLLYLFFLLLLYHTTSLPATLTRSIAHLCSHSYSCFFFHVYAWLPSIPFSLTHAKSSFYFSSCSCTGSHFPHTYSFLSVCNPLTLLSFLGCTSFCASFHSGSLSYLFNFLYFITEFLGVYLQCWLMEIRTAILA